MKRSVRCRGFSLLEVTIAIVVTGVALVGIYAMIPVSVQNVGISATHTRLAQFADEVVASLEGKAHLLRAAKKTWPGDFRQNASYLSDIVPSSSFVLGSDKTIDSPSPGAETIKVNGQINTLVWVDKEGANHVSHPVWYRVKIIEPTTAVSRMRHARLRDGKSKWVKVEVWGRPVRGGTTAIPDAAVYAEILNPVF